MHRSEDIDPIAPTICDIEKRREVFSRVGKGISLSSRVNKYVVLLCRNTKGIALLSNVVDNEFWSIVCEEDANQRRILTCSAREIWPIENPLVRTAPETIPSMDLKDVSDRDWL
jgi:hypothetical protein